MQTRVPRSVRRAHSRTGRSRTAAGPASGRARTSHAQARRVYRCRTAPRPDWARRRYQAKADGGRAWVQSRLRVQTRAPLDRGRPVPRQKTWRRRNRLEPRRCPARERQDASLNGSAHWDCGGPASMPMHTGTGVLELCGHPDRRRVDQERGSRQGNTVRNSGAALVQPCDRLVSSQPTGKWHEPEDK